MSKATRLITLLIAVLVSAGAICAQETDMQRPPDSKTSLPTYLQTNTQTDGVKNNDPNSIKNSPPVKDGPTSNAGGTIEGGGTVDTIPVFTGATEIGNSVITQSSGNITTGGTIGVQGTTPASNIGIKLARTGAISSALGLDISLQTSLSGSDLFGGRFSSQSTTSGGLPDHPFAVGLSGYGSFTGSGRLDFAEGTESVVFNSGSGHMQDAYATFNQVFNSGSGTMGAAYGSFNDVVNLSTSQVIQVAVAFNGKIRNFNAGGITTAYGLKLAGWSKGSGAVGTSYGIFMDDSIDLGTTRFALYSSSTSDSYFGGNVGVGTATPAARLAVLSSGPSTEVFSVANSSNRSYMSINQDGSGKVNLGIGDVGNAGNGTLITMDDGDIRGGTTLKLVAPAGTVSLGDAGVGNGSILALEDSSQTIFIENANVGIGTSTPSAALHVVGDFIATGTKSAAVKVANNRMVRMYAVESPENWFEDFGTGKLNKGVAVVVLDKTFTETVNTGVDYHVFITPNGNCRGLFVAEKTTTGFRVRELRGGKSNASFDFRIVARRKGYEDVRLQELKVNAP